MKALRIKLVPKGFTLMEMLVVVVIISILVAMLMPVFAVARRKGKEVATASLLKNLEDALTHYRNDWQGSYPVIQLPTTTTTLTESYLGNTSVSTTVTKVSVSNVDLSIFDTGDGNFNPGFFQIPCAAIGNSNADPGLLPAIATVPDYPVTAWQTGDNGPLIRRLTNNNYYKVNTQMIVNDRLVDYFGSTIVARFLIVPSTTLMADGKTPEHLTVKTYLWSYGYNMKNDTNAAPVYSNLGLNSSNPNQSYDYVENQNLINSIPSAVNIGDDDIINWQQHGL